jgi:hypothetical protein
MRRTSDLLLILCLTNRMACKHISSHLFLGFTIDPHVIVKVPLGGMPG